MVFEVAPRLTSWFRCYDVAIPGRVFDATAALGGLACLGMFETDDKRFARFDIGWQLAGLFGSRRGLLCQLYNMPA